MTEEWEDEEVESDDADPGFLGGGGPAATLGEDDPLLDEHGDRLAGDVEEFDDDEID